MMLSTKMRTLVGTVVAGVLALSVLPSAGAGLSPAAGAGAGVGPGSGTALGAAGHELGGHELSQTAGTTAPFLVGAAAVPLDLEEPFDGIWLGGYGSNRPMTHMRDQLYARAIAITGDGGTGETFIVVTTTNVGLFAAHKSEVEGSGFGPTGAYDIRRLIATETGLPMEGIVIQSDHSHAGPDTIGLWRGTTREYMEIQRDAAVAAAVEAYTSREPAVLKAAGVLEERSPVTLADDEEWRVLVAETPDESPDEPRRIATLSNFSSHATVLGSSNVNGGTGDWAHWAAEIAEDRYGGVGLGVIGALGSHTTGRGVAEGWDGGWDKSGTPDAREVIARERIEDFFDMADAALEPVEGSTVAVDIRFIREQATQPILLGVAMAPPLSDTLRVERAITPPWITGSVIGTYAGAARVGDVFFPAAPGEVFGEVNTHLRANVGARASFFIGAANDFLGYLPGSVESYIDSFENGGLQVLGCPERDLRRELDRPSGCSDRWTLAPSATLGIHVRCVQEDAARRLGFTLQDVDLRCPALMALDPLPAGAE